MLVKGSLYAIASLFFGVIFAAIVSVLRQKGFSAEQLIFDRALFAMLFFVPYLSLKSKRHLLKTTRIWSYVWRATLGTGSMYFYFQALPHFALSEIAAITFLVPIATSIFANIHLKEPLHLHTFGSLIIGIIGVYIVLDVDIVNLLHNKYVWMLFASVILWSICNIIIKKAVAIDSPVTTTFYMHLLLLPIMGIYSEHHISNITLDLLPMFLGVALFSVLLQMSLAKAFTLVPINVVMPLDFTKLIFSSFIGYYFLGQTTNHATLVGGLIIFASSLYGVFGNKLFKLWK
jgi:drug/metabolite transporter (DMT)-like permease